jgi:hypothetical protein
VTTKQNILCDGRSVRTVIAAAAAASTGNETAEDKIISSFSPPRFNYLLPSRPQLFVLVLDRSALLAQAVPLQDTGAIPESSLNWESLQKALFQFISKLPVGVKLAIISYGGVADSAAVNLPPTLVTERNREGLHGRIPRRALMHDTESCLDCALRMAFKAMRVENNDAASRRLEGTIVLATKSTTSPSVSEENLNTVRANHLPVYSVALTAGGANKKIADLTRFGRPFVVPHSGNNRPKYLSHLSETFTAIVRESSAAKIVACHMEHRVPNVDNVISGNFVIEEHLRKNLWVVVTADDERDIESFDVLSPTGKKHSFPTYEHGMAYFNLAGMAEPGIWSYTIRLYQTLASHYPVYLEVLGESSDSDAITLNTWHVQAGETGTEIYIYAEVKQGALPVLDAMVVATVARPLGDDGVETVHVELRDLGTGYPDITKGDGIYSGYFTDFSPQSGSYQVTVSATHNHGNARTPKLSASLDADDNVCCGSATPVSYTIPTGPFQRFVVGPSFYVEQTTNFYVRQGSRLINDIFPPSRITDFAFDNYLDDSLFVTLKWTAPGGDYDLGKAFRYEIRCYTNREALRDDNFADMSIPVHATLIPAPEDNGVEQRCTVGVPWPNEIFYYAIVAFDEAGNRGKISNTIAVYIKEEPSTVAPETGHMNEVDDKSMSRGGEPLTAGDHNNLTFIIVGIICGVLVVLIVLSIVAIRRHYRFLTGAVIKDSERPGQSETDEDDQSSLADTIKKIIPTSASSSKTEDKGSRMIWSGGSSPTSDYSSQKSPLPSLSETISWRQKATSQELPAVHRVMQAAEAQSAATTECSLYDSSDGGSDGRKSDCFSHQLPTRISVMEDYSVYRDLSNLSNCDYFSFSQLPAELRDAGNHVITVPPYYDIGTWDSATARKNRHESLV